jgi:hypothetical protein
MRGNMANIAPDWVLGWVGCKVCGYEWNAATAELPNYSVAIAAIVTGLKEFQCPCPRCGQERCQIVNILGE